MSTTTSDNQDRDAELARRYEEIEEAKDNLKKEAKRLHSLQQSYAELHNAKVLEEDFDKNLEECTRVQRLLDRWREDPQNKYRTAPVRQSEVPFSATFLGTTFSEWAARTRYRGILPPSGGFFVDACGTVIMIDPGTGTLSSLFALSYAVSPDYILVTHSHPDACGDLGSLVQFLNPESLEQDGQNSSAPTEPDQLPTLIAHESVLFGYRSSSDRIHRGARKYDFQRLGGEKVESTQKLIEKRILADGDRVCLTPPKLNSYDLFLRLRGNYQELEIGKEYALQVKNDEYADELVLHARKSFHGISYATAVIPSLDLIARKCGRTVFRVVYLSDTEFRTDLYQQYAVDSSPIDLLVCNVKTLNASEYDKDSETYDGKKADAEGLVGYTQKHLGYRGVEALARDLKSAGLLDDKSLVVMRNWSIECVTRYDPATKSLISSPEKLETCKRFFSLKTGLHTLIPCITQVEFKKDSEEEPFDIKHIQRPYVEDERRFGTICYRSVIMKDIVREARAAARTREQAILITGPSGSGKDALAEAIHRDGLGLPEPMGRKDNLVIVNAKEFSDSLGMALATGFDKGVFSGAVKSTRGWFAEAGNGTLIIQEASELPQSMQTGFLTVLTERSYTRLSSNPKRHPLTTQVIFTTSKDLEKLAEEGRFEPDLCHRLKRKLSLPSLKERMEDIEEILALWREEYRIQGTEVHIPPISDQALGVLKSYDWPGNVHELQEIVLRLGEKGIWSPGGIQAEIEKQKKGHNRLASPEPASTEVMEERRRLLGCPDVQRIMDIARKRANRMIQAGDVRAEFPGWSRNRPTVVLKELRDAGIFRRTRKGGSKLGYILVEKFLDAKGGDV